MGRARVRARRDALWADSAQPEYLHFVYPPLVAAVFAPLSVLNVSATKVLWLLLKIGAFLATVRLWQRRIAARQDVVPALFYFTFAFGSAALVDFTAGNIAIFEQLLLWLGFAALLSRRWWTFVALVIVAAQAKLTPVFFLGLLLVIDERPRWSPFLAGALLFALVVGANAILLPDQTREFLASVSSLGERGWGNPSTLGAMEDLVDQLRGLRSAAARGDGPRCSISPRSRRSSPSPCAGGARGARRRRAIHCSSCSSRSPCTRS